MPATRQTRERPAAHARRTPWGLDTGRRPLASSYSVESNEMLAAGQKLKNCLRPGDLVQSHASENSKEVQRWRQGSQRKMQKPNTLSSLQRKSLVEGKKEKQKNSKVAKAGMSDESIVTMKGAGQGEVENSPCA